MSIKDKENSSSRQENNGQDKKKLIILLIIGAFCLGSVIAAFVSFLLLKSNISPKNDQIVQTPQPTISSSPTPEPIIPTSTPTPTPSPFPTEQPISQEPKTPLNNLNNIDILAGSKIFSDRVSFNDQEKRYSFRLDKASNVSLYLDKVTNQVGLELYADTNNDGLVDSNELKTSTSAYSSSVGAISEALGPDNYIVVVKFNNANSDFTLQLTNNTSQAENVGELKGSKAFNGTINSENRKKYYKFTLNSPTNVNFYLDKVTNPLNILLYVDKNKDGIINNDEQVDSATAYNSSPAKLSQKLGADTYVIIVSERENNTSYTLTLSSQ